MKVKCKINNLNDFTNKRIVNRLKEYIFNSDGDIGLVLGKEYVVYGIIFWGNSPWYYLCSEDDDDYPVPYPWECFDVLNHQLSSYWQLSSWELSEYSGYAIESALVIKEWAQDRSFYELLLDEEPSVVSLFLEYKELMNQEYL